MRVPLGGRSVGRPARVRNAGGAVQRQPRYVLGQRLDAARELAGDDASSRLDRHARRVVAAIPETALTPSAKHIDAPYVPCSAQSEGLCQSCTFKFGAGARRCAWNGTGVGGSTTYPREDPATTTPASGSRCSVASGSEPPVAAA